VELLEDRLVPAMIFVHNHADGVSAPFVGPVAPNLRSAVYFSNPGDVIELDNATYTLMGGNGGNELNVTHDLVIRNAGGGVSTIDGQNQTRVFEIGGQASVTMTGLSIERGNGNGLTMGGGIVVDAGASLTLTGDQVRFNSPNTGAFVQGGGIYNAGKLTVINTTISSNGAEGEFNNEAEGPGAAEGAGIYSIGMLTLSNSVLADNYAAGGTHLVGRGGVVSDPARGGGVFVGAAAGPVAAVITATSFLGNEANGGDAGGGGLYQASNTGSITITASTFHGNTAQGQENSVGVETISGSASGGALYQNSGAGSLSLFNSTVANNVAAGGSRGFPGGRGGNAIGGGVFLGGSGPDLLVNDTIAQNAVVPGGPGEVSLAGGLFTTALQAGSGPKVWNTLIAENFAASDPDVGGALLSLGHNLVGNTAGSVGFNAARPDLLNIPASQIGLDNIANNGGPTATMRLEPFSIAVNHGDSSVVAWLKTDQRGLPRLSGAAVDIGAFELQVPVRRGRGFGP